MLASKLGDFIGLSGQSEDDDSQHYLWILCVNNLSYVS